MTIRPPSFTLNVRRSYARVVIRSFRDKETEKVFRREFSRRFQRIAMVAKRKLDQVNAATALNDLAVIPGNRLEALAGDRERKHSIRINDQWRICFRWAGADALEVEIVDYH
jgi:toxin HigB-1